MKVRIFAVLFVCTMIPLFIGMGLFPLLPLYAARFGATRTDIGIFFAVVYIASAASVIGTGWLAERFSRRKLFLIGAALGPATMVLLAHATALWQVVVLIAIAWMSGGITLTLLNVFTATLAEPTSRGRVFGLMFLVYPLDALLGGAAIGQLTSAYGYSVMFYALAAMWIIQPVVGLFGLRDPRITRPPLQVEVRQSAAPLGRAFTLLIVSALLSIACTSVGRLGTSLAMQALGYGPNVVASTTIVSGLVTIPLALGIGALSDRTGRRPMLVLGTLVGAAGTTALVVATSAWQFQLAATLLLAGWCISRAISSALAADMLTPETMGRGLSRLAATDSIASIVSFGATGYVMETFGSSLLFVTATAFGVVSAIALAGLSQTNQARKRARKGLLVMERSGVIVPRVRAEASQHISR